MAHELRQTHIPNPRQNTSFQQRLSQFLRRNQGMTTQHALHRFRAFTLSLDIIRSLHPLCPRIRRNDPALVKQLRNAASSVSLNLAESRGRVGKDRAHFFRIAAGSAEEVAACLLVATAWNHLAEDDIAEVLEQLSHMQAMIRSLLRT